MFNILTLNKIAEAGINCFDKDTYNVSGDVEKPDGILVRSASLHEMEFPKSLKAIARAGAGVNNIPLDRCSGEGIVVFNTPGANANAVKELVIAGLIISSRRIIDAVQWVNTLKDKGEEVPKLVEKGKSQFAGPEIKGKTLGVIGLGAIGVLVANSARRLGMEVYGYDPYLSVDSAWGLSSSVHRAASLQQIYEISDYITLHVPLTPDTKSMIDKSALAMMKENVRIMNFARAELVNSSDMLKAIESGKVACYVADFPTHEMLGVENVISIPHLGASTPESEENCAVMAAHELIDYLETGSIINSVNFPEVELPKAEHIRICVLHRNIPNMLAQISAIVSKTGVNIEMMVNRSKKDNAYTILDVNDDVSDECMEAIEAIDGVIRTRKII